MSEHRDDPQHLEARIRELEERLQIAEDRNADVAMLAHRWMVAHDSLQAGKPYDFPSPADLPKSEARCRELQAQVEGCRGALEPFARFLDALEQMGGNTPKTGVWHAVESSVTGLREITIEDFQAARQALALLKDPGNGK